MSVFQRKTEHDQGPKVDAPRIMGAVLHLLIPLVTYNWMYNGYGQACLSLVGLQPVPEAIVDSQGKGTSPLGYDRMFLLMYLDVVYAIRWAFGFFTMNGTVNLPTAIIVSFYHLLVHCMMVSGISMIITYRIDPGEREIVVNGLPALNWVDGVGAMLCLSAALLQHGAEAQRFSFKRDLRHKGKLHTTGLFGWAQFINHTGHIMRDLGAALLARSMLLLVIAVLSAVNLVGIVTPKTVAHLKMKYGAQHAAYAKKNPYLFLPWLY